MRSKLDSSASPSDKLDFILAHICNYEFGDGRKKNKEGGTIIDFGYCYMHLDFNYFGLTSYHEMVFYLETLEEKGFISINISSNAVREHCGDKIRYKQYGKLLFKGLSYLSEIENRGILSNKCFVAMPFDVYKSERLDAIKQACLEYQFDAFIVEQYKTKDNQTIDANIIAAIKSSRFCIVDFTSANQGAYLEAGYAMGRGMKVIFICNAEDFDKNRKHFDVRHYPFIMYTGFTDLSAKLKVEIAAYIND